MKKEFITGSEAVVKGALASGAEFMAGYPITPTTEILENFALEVSKNPKIKIFIAEDEMSAGFAMIGAILAGKKAFTATAGPGNVLMQDAFSMAENMRLPTVALIGQRGGPSTGTVIYSQQEVNLTCFGGNGEGLRIVYSVSNTQELFDYTAKAFNTAWRYRFPTFVLTDGYNTKTMTNMETKTQNELQEDSVTSKPYLLKEDRENGKSVNLRNTYNLETELNEIIRKNKGDYDGITSEIVEYEDLQTLDAEIVIFAHGIVAASAKRAIEILRNEGKKVGLFRPITLRPFPAETAKSVVKNKKVILVVESSLGQFVNLVKSNLYGETVEIKKLARPALGIEPEDIVNKVNELFTKVKETNE